MNTVLSCDASSHFYCDVFFIVVFMLTNPCPANFLSFWKTFCNLGFEKGSIDKILLNKNLLYQCMCINRPILLDYMHNLLCLHIDIQIENSNNNYRLIILLVSLVLTVKFQIKCNRPCIFQSHIF